MNTNMFNKFKKYINGTSVKSVKRQCIANTLSCVIIELLDCEDNLKTIVVADRALVSFDKGLYFHIDKCDEIDTLILSLISDF